MSAARPYRCQLAALALAWTAALAVRVGENDGALTATELAETAEFGAQASSEAGVDVYRAKEQLEAEFAHFPGNDESKYALTSNFSWPTPLDWSMDMWFRITSKDVNQGFIVSYAVPEMDNCYLLKPRPYIDAHIGKWLHLAVSVYSDSSKGRNGVDCWLNGVKVASAAAYEVQSLCPRPICDTQGGTLVLGQEQDYVGGGFQRSQGEAVDFQALRTYKGLLTDQQVADLSAKSCSADNMLWNNWAFKESDPKKDWGPAKHDWQTLTVDVKGSESDDSMQCGAAKPTTTTTSTTTTTVTTSSTSTTSTTTTTTTTSTTTTTTTTSSTTTTTTTSATTTTTTTSSTTTATTTITMTTSATTTTTTTSSTTTATTSSTTTRQKNMAVSMVSLASSTFALVAASFLRSMGSL